MSDKKEKSSFILPPVSGTEALDRKQSLCKRTTEHSIQVCKKVEDNLQKFSIQETLLIYYKRALWKNLENYAEGWW